MGNTPSEYEKIDVRTCINTIFKLDFPVLDIGNKKGVTGYLDFIIQNDLGDNDVMKGKDTFKRRFIVFKANVMFNDGSIKQTFTTFFQRYSDDDILWHCCGLHGENLMCTEGGAKLKQMQFLYELLSQKKYTFKSRNEDDETYGECENLRLPYYWLSKEIYPVSVELGN